MTVASEIQRIEGNISAAYTAADAKGATIPATENSDNLATCIASIPAGGGGTLVTKSITTNGVYDASNDNADGYSSVSAKVLPTVKTNFAVTSSDGTTFTISNIDYNGTQLDAKLTELDNSNFGYAYNNNTELREISLAAINSLTSDAGLSNLCAGCTNLKNADFSSIPEISSLNCFSSCFNGCTNLEKVDFTSLATVSGSNAFYYFLNGCTSLVAFNLPSLTTVSGYGAFSQACQGCTSLTTINLPSLTTLSGINAFYGAWQGCTSLASVVFPLLSVFGANSELSNAFKNCTNIESISFPAITTNSFTGTNTFQNMLNGTGNTKVHTIHFPSNLESTIQGLTTYPLFGGDSDYVTLAFDLPATS